jgi:hypothetical protein
MDTVGKQELAARTRERNAMTWLSLDYGGILAPLVPLEIDLDTLASPSIENFMAISDEAWGIKEGQRDRTVELSQAEVEQDRAIADAKAATGRAKIAIEKAADEYTLAVKVYDARVKGLIMGAKEFAALVEQEQLANEEARAGLAVDKEALHLKEVKAKIYLQTIEQAQVEADIAKAQVEVAKAHVRAAMAGIDAGEAGIKLIQAQTEVYIAEAEKATLQADVAMILAEIMTKRLSEVKLDVGQKEIAAGFAYIQTKLADALAMYDIRGLIEQVRTDAEVAIAAEIGLLLAVEQAEQDLKNLEADYARLNLTYEVGQTEINIQEEVALKARMVAARERLSDARKAQSIERDMKQTWAQELLNTAHKFTYKHRKSEETRLTTSRERIKQG